MKDESKPIAYEAPYFYVDFVDSILRNLGLEDVMAESFNFGPTEQYFDNEMLLILYALPNLPPHKNLYVGVQQGRMPIDDGENKHYPSGIIAPRTVVSFYGVGNSPSLCELIVEKLTEDSTDFREDTLFPQERDFQFYLN